MVFNQLGKHFGKNNAVGHVGSARGCRQDYHLAYKSRCYNNIIAVIQKTCILNHNPEFGCGREASDKLNKNAQFEFYFI